GASRQQLAGVARDVLSRQAAGREDARVLHRALRHGRDQRDVLPDAERQDPRVVGRDGARRLHLRPEGSAADHALQAAPRRRRAGPLLRRHGGRKRAPAPAPARRPTSNRARTGPPPRGGAGPGARALPLESRHEGWSDAGVYPTLRTRNAPPRLAEPEEAPPPAVSTADFGYLR